MAANKVVYLVVSDSGLEGIFEVKEHADKFAEQFRGSNVEEDTLYTAVPKLYQFSCTVNMVTGDVIRSDKINSTFHPPTLVEFDEHTLSAVGETAEEAETVAKQYRQKISSL